MRKTRFRKHGNSRKRISRITRNGIYIHSIRDPYKHQQYLSEAFHQSEDISILREQAKLIEAKLEQINKKLKKYNNKTNTKLVAYIDQGRCTGCTRCVACCPYNAISINNNVAEIVQTKCQGCGLCVTECKKGAITLKNLN